MSLDARPTIRIDKWLWHARFFKTRTLAATVVSGGKVRVDGTPVAKPARLVGPGNVLTFVAGEAVRVVRIIECGDRRGPATEAQDLYEDLSPAPPPRDVQPENPAYDGKGRPGKRERRNIASQGLDDGSFDLE